MKNPIDGNLNRQLVRTLRNIAILLVAMTAALGWQSSFVYAQEVVANVPSDTTATRAASDTAATASAMKRDSLATKNDSIAADSALAKKKKPEGGGLTAVVNYKSSDSLVFSMGNQAWLYGNSEVTYDDINLTAERIQMSLDSSLVHANGVPDPDAPEGSKMLIGAPVFIFLLLRRKKEVGWN